jgi:hypothetical protein
MSASPVAARLFAAPTSLRLFLVGPDDTRVLRPWCECVLEAHDNVEADEARRHHSLGKEFRALLVHVLRPTVPALFRVYALLVYLFCCAAAQQALPDSDRRFLAQVVQDQWGTWITGRDRAGLVFARTSDIDDAHTVQFAWRMMQVYRARGWATL